MTNETALLTRRIAIDLVGSVIRNRRPLDAALADDGRMGSLESRDRAFVRRLVATTLRRLGQIDALIEHCLDRPLPRKAQEVRSILQLGVCQLFFTDVADHAAVDTAVEMTRKFKLHGFAKLVNGVLRRLIREGAKLLAAQDAPRLNTPEWMWASWVETYGPDTCRRIAEAHLEKAPLDISAKGSAAEWVEPLDARLLDNGTLRRDAGGAVYDLPGFAEGQWWVQDAAARCVVQLLGDVGKKSIIDLCAAPGGKSVYLAATGAQVTAVDRSAKRLIRLRENLNRLALNAEIITADAVHWRPETCADAVLVDAPCSATGTIRRHPDILWNKTQDDIDALSKTQSRLIGAAVDMVKPGGVIVYATCSLQPEESRQQVESLMQMRDDVLIDPIKMEELAGFDEAITPEGMFRSLPSHLHDKGGMDGFFACRLRRQ